MKVILLFIMLSFFGLTSFAQAGMLDSTFSEDGIVTIFPDEGYGQDIAVQSDGKIVAGGEISSDGFVVIRFNDDGSLDSTFGVNGVAQTIVGLGFNQDEKIAIQADGKIVVGGVCANFDGYFNCALVRFNSNGTIDNTFGIGGKVIYAYSDPHDYFNSADDLVITPDQKIMTAGRVGISTGSGFATARFDANGLFDNTFGTNGIAITPIGNPFAGAFSIKIQNDGKAVLGGDTYSTSSSSFAIVRFKVDGSLDNTFSSDGKDTIYFYNPALYDGGSVARDVYIQADAKILLAGEFGSEKDSLDYAAIARYNSDGTLDGSFSLDGKLLLSAPGFTRTQALTAAGQIDGRIIFGGYCYSPGFPNPYPTTLLFRLLQDGTLDSTFGKNGFVDSLPEFDVAILSVAMDKQQRIVAVGVSDSGITVLRFLSGLNVGIVDINNNAESPLLYPNPIGQNAVLEYSLQNPQTVSIHLIDMNGKIVKTFIENENQSAGDYKQTLDIPSNLPAGSYLIIISTGTGKRVSVKVVK